MRIINKKSSRTWHKHTTTLYWSIRPRFVQNFSLFSLCVWLYLASKYKSVCLYSTWLYSEYFWYCHWPDTLTRAWHSVLPSVMSWNAMQLPFMKTSWRIRILGFVQILSAFDWWSVSCWTSEIKMGIVLMGNIYGMTLYRTQNQHINYSRFPLFGHRTLLCKPNE